MIVRALSSLADIPRAAWDGLARDGNPFLEWAYLEGLERSGAVSEDTGWQPEPPGARGGGQVLAALPLYLKDHSWGEFVFDFAWADAYRRAGVAYYPKLVAAIPFTPVPGARILTASGVDADEAGRGADRRGARTRRHGRGVLLHLLLPEDRQLPLLHAPGSACARIASSTGSTRATATSRDSSAR
jgi:uncharacterized protein